jgi:hypothetical protein
LPISKDVAVNRLGIGVIGVADDDCDGFVTMDGGYEITDLESKRSDEISMSAIVVMGMNNSKIRRKEYVYE